MKRLISVLLMIAALFLTVVPGIGQTTDSELRMGVSVYPANLFAPRATSQADTLLKWVIYNCLVEYDPETLEIVPMLARTYEISPDGKTYTFYLKEGIQFHGGYGELTAEDVKFSIEGQLDPTWLSKFKGRFSILESVEVVDRYTVEINIVSPAADFLDTLAWNGHILCKKAFDELGLDGLVATPIGTGEFYVEDMVQGQEVELRAFEDHFRGWAILDRLVYSVIPEATVSLNAVRTGELHVTPLQQLSGYVSAKGLDDIQVVESIPAQQCYVLLHQAVAPTDDLAVRMAIAHAINWEEVSEAFQGLVLKNQCWVPEFVLGFTSMESQYSYDPIRAATLLEAAGLSKPTLQIITTTGEIYPDMAQVLKQQLASLFDVEITIAERGEWVASWREGGWNLWIGLLTRYDPGQFANLVLQSGGSCSINEYANDWMDEQLLAGGEAVDPDRRAAIYKMIQYAIWRDLPLLNAGTVRGILAVHKSVRGLITMPYVGVIDFLNVSIEE